MIVFLTAADTDLLTLQSAVRKLNGLAGPVRACNVRSLHNEEEVRAYCQSTLARADVVILRLLGGKNHFQIGFEPIVSFCKAHAIPLIAIPGDQEIDTELTAVCTAPLLVVNQIFTYCTLGGVENFAQMLRYVSDAMLKTGLGFEAPQTMPLHGLYCPEGMEAEDSTLPTVGLLFYRAHWMSGDTACVDAMIRAFRLRGINARAVFCYSLKHSIGEDAQGLQEIFQKYFSDAGRPAVRAVVSALSYTVAELETLGAVQATGKEIEFLGAWNVPVFQAVLCGMSRLEWENNPAGLSPRDTAMKVALPEFDGRVLANVIGFTESKEMSEELGTSLARIVPDAERVHALTSLVGNWIRLGEIPASDKKLAIILTNFPNKNARIGNAVGLDTPASAIAFLHALAREGYDTGEIPPDGDALIHSIIARCSLDKDEVTEAQLNGAVGHVPASRYGQWFSQAGLKPQSQMTEAWGSPPGEAFVHEGRLVIPGVILGNIFIGIQPARGFGDNPRAIYHSPDLVPTHHYLAFYRWLREDFGANAVIHFGKHGTLEWLPGKSLGLSADCYPDLILQDIPNFYPFIVNDPGEGTQAKRRAHAVIVDHLIPPMTRAETYDQLAKMEQLMDEYYRMSGLDPAKLPLIRQQIWSLAVESNLNKDLQHDACPEDFDHFLQEMDGYLCEIKDSQIRDGLHIFGQIPQGESLVDLLIAITRLANPKSPGLRAALLEHFGFDAKEFQKDLGRVFDDDRGSCPGAPAFKTYGDVIDSIHALSKTLLTAFAREGFAPAAIPRVLDTVLQSHPENVARVLAFVASELVPNLLKTDEEIRALCNGLRGGFVPPGPSGAPTRGMANVLPTGRNFYSVDIHRIPSPAAWEVGQAIARELLERYHREEGHYPESVGMVAWGTANMRTHGDDIAQALYLLGTRPQWNLENSRVEGLELIPLAELGRPRIDVTLRISGFFRDAFPNLLHLLDKAVEMVAHANEDAAQNYVRKHWLAEKSLYRIFGSKPGAYGTGILPVIQEQNWKTDKDLADIYLTWGGYAYTQKEYGKKAHTEFQQRLSQINVVTQNQDNREHDIFDSDDYFQFHGGMIASIRSLTGSNPKAFFGDTSRPGDVRMRSIKEEANLVFRSRVVNPKWIAAMQRHGYKGAFEMAATMDYLFSYDATAHVVEDWMYEKIADAYLFDPDNRAFLEKSNPWALGDMAKRLLEAAQRELWENPDPETLQRLKDLAIEAEAALEGRAEDEVLQ